VPTVTESIQDFLRSQREHHPGPDLLDRWGPNLETQINVAADDGEPVPDRRNTWTNGVNKWWNIRIPKNAKSDPDFQDYELRWSLAKHAEGVGSTGWDWMNRRSVYAGFDFDAITGHAAGVGLSPEQLEEVRQAAMALPYVEVRRSTGGKGIHLYVHFDGEGIPTANHTEHAALARCVLAMMSSETGFDFASQIDCCGSILWIWHRKLNAAHQGLGLVKAAAKRLSESDLPDNWKDHVEVVARRRAKIRVRAVNDDIWDQFEALASSRRTAPLDEKHKAVIDELTRSGYSTIWVPDHHLLQSHTCALQQLMQNDKLRRELGLIGLFQTNSPGSDPGTPNCFMFPQPSGAWSVFRFSPGVQEAETWGRSDEGWTRCYFNQAPDLTTAAKAMGGAELADNGGFMFDTAREALRVIETLGETIDLKDKFHSRETHLRKNKDGRLVVRIKQNPNEEKPDKGWSSKKGGWWERVYNMMAEPRRNNGVGATEFDNIVRALVSPAGERAGWVISRATGGWDRVPKDDAKSALLAMGHAKADADVILGCAVLRSWKTVHLPFQPEYPGDRQWNLGAAQLRYPPAGLRDDDIPHHPHWDKILDHCFGDLDEAICREPWARRANIRTGAQYGLAWIACMLREPFEPLPYLFLFGPENSGKSILHEALALLVTGGVVRADRALANQNEFNGELANAVLAVVEEVNVAASPLAHNRIKDWVTSRTLWIRKMRTDAYSQPNTLHFIQCANHQSYCPVLPGDTRITVVYVPDLLKEQEVAKTKMMEHLIEEAPHFMHTLMNLELPPVEGRLRVPVVNTSAKTRSEELNRDPVETYIMECCFPVPGEKIPFAEFYDRFLAWLPESEHKNWHRQKVSKHLPVKYPVGACTNNKRYIGNLSWEPSTKVGTPYVAINGRLRQTEDT
jgi:hypothetical protein